MTSQATARPSCVAALEPSTSASRATTFTTLPDRLHSSAPHLPTTSNSPTQASTGRQVSAASTPTFTQGFNSLNTYYPDPAVAQFSLGVQHEIAPALILITQYVGNLDWHQNVWIPINNFPLSTPMATRQSFANGSLGTVPSLVDKTYPGFGNIRLQSTTQTGTYNSFQAGLRQQNKHGLSFELDYTYAHQIDSTPGSVDVDNNNPTRNPWNLKYDKGSGILDRRQVFSGNYEYRLPFFNQASGLTRSVLGGWEISGTIISETGLPWAGNVAPRTATGIRWVWAATTRSVPTLPANRTTQRQRLLSARSRVINVSAAKAFRSL